MIHSRTLGPFAPFHLFSFVVALAAFGCSSNNTPAPAPVTPPNNNTGVVNNDSGAVNVVTVAPNETLVFSPSTMTIHVGDSVHWVWAGTGHTVTSGTPGVPDNKFCSPNDQNCGTPSLGSAGATYDHTFTVAGTYPYFCFPHFSEGMTGTVTVQ